MIAENIVGNESVKYYLNNIINNGRLGSSYIFYGPAGVGKTAIAHSFAKAVVGGKSYAKEFHPDIHINKPEGKLGLHSMESLRALIKEVYLPPNESNHKVFIIQNAEQMLSYSANALLKTLEEPPEDTIIILVCDHLEGILPTILSRCNKLAFQLIPEEDIAKFLIQNHSLDVLLAQRIAWLSNGSIAEAINIMQNGEDPNREIILDLFSGVNSSEKLIFEAVEKIIDNFKSVEFKEHSEVIDDKAIQLLTAVQREALDAELKGFVALQRKEYFLKLFVYILAWYRDLALMMSGGEIKFLFHRDSEDKLRANIDKKQTLSLDKIQRTIHEAELSLSRSTKVENVLETLLFSLLK